MTWDTAFWIYTAGLVGLLLAGVPIGTAMGAIGILGITMNGGLRLWPSLGDIVWNTANSFTLTALPLFVLMGEIILRSGMSRRLYTGLSVLLNAVPGRLAQSNIVACAVFSAISGSSTATALTIGTVALPEMRARGYCDELTLGTLTGGGALGNLIPPSIFMLVYGAVVQESVIDLFVASLVPGVLATLMFMAYVAVRVAVAPELVPPRAPRHTWGQIAVAIGQCAPTLLLIVSVIGGMYFGVMTPTEAAAVGCGLTVVMAAAHRELSWAGLYGALKTTIAVSGVVMFIIINGQILGFAVVHAGIAREMARNLLDAGLGPFAFFTALFILYLVLGTFLDGVSMMLLTVPVIYPTLKAMGFDGVWFGVILVIQSELAQLSPPIGLNLFAVQSVARDVTMAEVAWASLPYAVMLSVLSFLLYWFPELALAPVAAMRGR
ncbi:MAG TPA: TRAP transporter large permease [Candidatus Binatia bacterium]|nr:TRAP transporter large permease [Candidatus Binatia bacterium]